MTFAKLIDRRFVTRRFLRSSRKSITAGLLGLCLLLSMPGAARASSEDEKEHYDARVQNYTPDVELKSWSTGMSWMMMICLGVVSVSVLFKSANRSHLD